MRRGRLPGSRGMGVMVAASLVGAALVPVAFAAPGASACGAIASPGGAPTASDSVWQALYAQGLPFPEFLDGARNRLPEWYAVAEQVVIPDSTLARARAVGGRWRLLVVAADTCGDSLRQVPYVARLAELVAGLSLRVVTPAVGGAVQATYRALDGRRATPTYLLLDEGGEARGCIVELPKPLRDSLHARRAEGTRESNRELATAALSWYGADRGASIVHEVVRLMEGARAGTPLCEHGAP